MIRLIRRMACLAILGSLICTVAAAQGVAHKPDLADTAQGTYFGSVTSDSRGSSQSDVTLTVTRTGPNQVRITSDYARLPIVSVNLTRAMDKILDKEGTTTFLLDPTQAPPRLDVTFDNEVSWSGDKRSSDQPSAAR